MVFRNKLLLGVYKYHLLYMCSHTRTTHMDINFHSKIQFILWDTGTNILHTMYFHTMRFAVINVFFFLSFEINLIPTLEHDIINVAKLSKYGFHIKSVIMSKNSQCRFSIKRKIQPTFILAPKLYNCLYVCTIIILYETFQYPVWYLYGKVLVLSDEIKRKWTNRFLIYTERSELKQL